MANPHLALGLDDFRHLVEAWPFWKKRFAPASVISDPTDRISAFSSISSHRDTWELAVAVAAYATLRQPIIVGLLRGTDMSIIVNSMLTLPGRKRIPGFLEFAESVARLPMKRLIRGAPRLARVLNTQPITASSFACAEFCWDHYGGDPARFVACLRDC